MTLQKLKSSVGYLNMGILNHLPSRVVTSSLLHPRAQQNPNSHFTMGQATNALDEVWCFCYYAAKTALEGLTRGSTSQSSKALAPGC